MSDDWCNCQHPNVFHPRGNSGGPCKYNVAVNPVKLVATRLTAPYDDEHYWGEITLVRDGYCWTSNSFRLEALTPDEAQQELDQLAQDLVNVSEPVTEDDSADAFGTLWEKEGS